MNSIRVIFDQTPASEVDDYTLRIEYTTDGSAITQVVAYQGTKHITTAAGSSALQRCMYSIVGKMRRQVAVECAEESVAEHAKERMQKPGIHHTKRYAAKHEK